MMMASSSRLAIGIACVLGFGGLCVAQGSVTSPNAARGLAGARGAASGVASSSAVHAAQNGLVGRAAVAPDVPLQGAAGLSGFTLRFANGDHKLNAIGVAFSGHQVLFSLQDQDMNDPFGASADWYQSPRFGAGNWTRAGRGESHALPAGPAGHLAVLRGFRLNRKYYTDANVREVTVRINNDERTVTAALYDDGGKDLRVSLESHPVGPTGGASLTAADADYEEAVSRMSGGVAAQVQIAWVPRDMVVAQRVMSGDRCCRQSGQAPAPGEKAVLTGFSARFGNSDHHLLQLAVGLAYREDGRYLQFSDGNGGDPVQWNIEYAVIR